MDRNDFGIQAGNLLYELYGINMGIGALAEYLGRDDERGGDAAILKALCHKNMGIISQLDELHSKMEKKPEKKKPNLSIA